MHFKLLSFVQERRSQLGRWLWQSPGLPLIPLALIAIWKTMPPDHFYGLPVHVAILLGSTVCAVTWLVFGQGMPPWLRVIVFLLLADVAISIYRYEERDLLANCAGSSFWICAVLRYLVGLRIEKPGIADPHANVRQYSLRTIFSLMAVVALFGGFLNRHRNRFSIDFGLLRDFLELAVVSATSMLVILGILSDRRIAITSCFAPTVAAVILSLSGQQEIIEMTVIMNLIGFSVALPTFIVRLYGYRTAWRHRFVNSHAKPD